MRSHRRVERYLVAVAVAAGIADRLRRTTLAGICKTRSAQKRVPEILKSFAFNAFGLDLRSESGSFKLEILGRTPESGVLQRPARAVSIQSKRFECRRNKSGAEGEAGDPAAGRRCSTTRSCPVGESSAQDRASRSLARRPKQPMLQRIGDAGRRRKRAAQPIDARGTCGKRPVPGADAASSGRFDWIETAQIPQPLKSGCGAITTSKVARSAESLWTPWTTPAGATATWPGSRGFVSSPMRT